LGSHDICKVPFKKGSLTVLIVEKKKKKKKKEGGGPIKIQTNKKKNVSTLLSFSYKKKKIK